MFTPIHLLRGADEREILGYRDRWLRDKAARSQQRLVLELITKGEGEDFLAPHVHHGELPILEDDGDLRGLRILDKKIDFPAIDNFIGLDLSYGMVAGCEFNGAIFTDCALHFSSFHDCVLRRCTFVSNNIYASTFRDVQFIDCVFPDQHFWNCEFFGSRFLSCSIADDLMVDCRADSTCEIKLPAMRQAGGQETHRALPDNKRASFFKGISDAYAVGGAEELSRRYYYKHMQEIRRHNTTRWIDKVLLSLSELQRFSVE